MYSIITTKYTTYIYFSFSFFKTYITDRHETQHDQSQIPLTCIPPIKQKTLRQSHESIRHPCQFLVRSKSCLPGN